MSTLVLWPNQPHIKCLAVIPSLEEKAQLKRKAILRKIGAIFVLPTSPRTVQRDNVTLLHLMSTSVTAYGGY